MLAVLLAVEHNQATGLHLACKDGHAGAVAAILSACTTEETKRAVLLVGDVHQVTALHLACAKGHASTVAAVLDSSPPKAVLCALDVHGNTPASLARFLGHWALADLLDDQRSASEMSLRTPWTCQTCT